jgi:nucleoside-diphosphate-sugar epimerase
MRVGVLGGTRFIGVAIVEELAGHGHDVLVVHRGLQERDDGPDVPHAHLDRHDVPGVRAALADAGAEVVVDTNAYSTRDARDLVAALDGRPAVVLSSMDVYRAFATLRAGAPATDMVPLDETSPLRGPEQRYLNRGHAAPLRGIDPDTYENLDVEEVCLAAGHTVLRLPMVYGERDELTREDFVLRRVRAGRRRIPFGAGTFLWTRGWVRDVAAAVRLAAETGAGAGQALNVGERRSPTAERWARDILAAAGSDAELVRVPDDRLPEDLVLTGAVAQHVLVDSARARALLGWAETDPAEALAASVRWHLAHPPADADPDFSADDRAMLGA